MSVFGWVFCGMVYFCKRGKINAVSVRTLMRKKTKSCLLIKNDFSYSNILDFFYGQLFEKFYTLLFEWL